MSRYDPEWVAKMAAARWGTMTPSERYWARVERTAGPDACWPWIGHRDRHGYGRLWFDGKMRLAHHVGLRLDGRELSAGMEVLHACDNPPCQNPSHLQIGTHRENQSGMAARGRSRNNPALGEQHPRSKLTEELVREIRTSGESGPRLASRLGLAKSTVNKVRTGRAWAHVLLIAAVAVLLNPVRP